MIVIPNSEQLRVLTSVHICDSTLLVVRPIGRGQLAQRRAPSSDPAREPSDLDQREREERLDEEVRRHGRGKKDPGMNIGESPTFSQSLLQHARLVQRLGVIRLAPAARSALRNNGVYCTPFSAVPVRCAAPRRSFRAPRVSIAG